MTHDPQIAQEAHTTQEAQMTYEAQIIHICNFMKD